MNQYQLSCGHWVNDWPGFDIGSWHGCVPCDTLKTTVIGFVQVVTS
jgi:hypothetical protein